MMSYNGREEGTRKKRKRIENEVVVSSTNNNNNNSIKPIFNERLNNLRILQTIIVLYSFLYDLFYIGGFFLILLSYYNHGEMIIYSVVFILNLINIIAIILFYYGLSKQNLYLIQIYQIINSIAIALELFMLAYAFIFSSDLEIRNLLSSVFLFIYECIFVASNIFVQWLVCVQLRSRIDKNQMKKTYYKQLHDLTTKSVKSNESIFSIQSHIKSIVDQLNDEVDQFVSNITRMDQMVQSIGSIAKS